MGRMHLRQLKVHDAMTLLRHTQPATRTPPWYKAIAEYPPAAALVRTSPVYHRPRPIPKKGRKASKAFKPMSMAYPEDKLRRDFFADHPWELARPRVLLEKDGRDGQVWDWNLPYQVGRPVNGESVVQRQMAIMATPLPTRDPATGATVLATPSKEAAYDTARKELYERRARDEMEMHIAREEALAVDAHFGPSANDVGMFLEGREFDRFKVYAEAQATLLEQARSAAYGGTPAEGEQKSDAEKVLDSMPDADDYRPQPQQQPEK